MGIQTETYERRPFDVEAVQVTEENMAAVAEWCGGKIRRGYNGMQDHIQVDTHRPLSKRQTTAFVGDWVLAYRGFKIYTPVAFEQSFRKKEK